MSQKSVEGFHSDLSIDDRSTLDPTYTSESSVTSSTMSDEMDEPIFDEWDISDLELESEDVGSEEVEVAISGRNVGRGRARGRGRGGRGSRLVVGETSTLARHRQESRWERHHSGSWWGRKCTNIKSNGNRCCTSPTWCKFDS